MNRAFRHVTRTTRWACFGLLVLAFSRGTWAQQPLLSSDLLRAFDRTVGLVEKRFYDPSRLGISWKMQVQETRSKLSKEPREPLLRTELNSLLAQLHASHTGFYAPTDQTYWALKSIYSGSITRFPICQIGAWFEPDEEGH